MLRMRYRIRMRITIKARKANEPAHNGATAHYSNRYPTIAETSFKICDLATRAAIGPDYSCAGVDILSRPK